MPRTGLRSDDTQVRRYAPGERDLVTPIDPETSRAAQKRYDHGPAILGIGTGLKTSRPRNDTVDHLQEHQ